MQESSQLQSIARGRTPEPTDFPQEQAPWPEAHAYPRQERVPIPINTRPAARRVSLQYGEDLVGYPRYLSRRLYSSEHRNCTAFIGSTG